MFDRFAKKIYNTNTMTENQTKTTSTDLTNLIIEAMQDRKAKDITIVDMSGIESASVGKFIICQATSTTQVSAIADNIREHLNQTIKRKPYGYDGYRNCQWIAIDYGEVIAHVFLPEFREFYCLEQLWNDAVITDIENLD